MTVLFYGSTDGLSLRVKPSPLGPKQSLLSGACRLRPVSRDPQYPGTGGLAMAARRINRLRRNFIKATAHRHRERTGNLSREHYKQISRLRSNGQHPRLDRDHQKAEPDFRQSLLPDKPEIRSRPETKRHSSHPGTTVRWPWFVGMVSRQGCAVVTSRGRRTRRDRDQCRCP